MKTIRPYWRVLGAGAVLALWLGVAWAAQPGDQAADLVVPVTPPLTAAPASPAPAGPQVRAQLTASRQTVLSAGMSAQVERLPVEEGQSFAQGDELARLECAVETAQHQKSLAEAQAARAKLRVNQQLRELQSASTLEVELSQAELDKAQAQVRLDAARLSACRQVAPFAGRVASLKVRRYQWVRVGEPLMEILDPSELEVELMAPSLWLRWLRVGESFSLSLDETGREYQARVHTLGARVDPVSQTVKVVGKLEGDTSGALPGMSGYARFQPPAATQPQP